MIVGAGSTVLDSIHTCNIVLRLYNLLFGRSRDKNNMAIPISNTIGNCNGYTHKLIILLNGASSHRHQIITI